MVLKEDGSVWATGWNEYGQLGDGTTIDRASYVQVVSSGVKAIAAGRRHSMVLKEDGSVWVTGCNEFGQLGDGSTTNSEEFVIVLSGGVIVAAGAFRSMVVMEDGSFWAAGSNTQNTQDTPENDSMMHKRTFVRLAPFCDGSA